MMDLEQGSSGGRYSQRIRFLCACLIGFEAYAALLFVYDWNHGVERGLLLLGLLLGLIALRFQRERVWSEIARAPGLIAKLLIIAIVLDLGISSYTIARSLHSNQIPMDQGQTTWRAARILWRGENPYGFGAVVDYYAFGVRLAARDAQGLGPMIPVATTGLMLAEYERTLDPFLRYKLLPASNEGKAPKPTEAWLVGYKYGPLLIVLTAMFVPLGIPAAVVLLNATACFMMLGAVYRLMSEESGQSSFAMLGVTALLLDRHLSWNYLNETATDVWPLLFGTLAVCGFQRGRMAHCAIFLALATSCKIFPSAVLIPLLFKSRSLRPLLIFLCVVTALYAPWFVWDPVGVLHNVFLWPIFMLEDTTSWVYYMPLWLSISVRLTAFAGVIWLWTRFLIGVETRCFWTLATVNVLLLFTGSVFHNNYLPWASIWIVAALVEKVTPRVQERAVIGRYRETWPKHLPEQPATQLP
jgi:hypothetical protein